MRMGIGLGVGINRSNYAQGIFSAYQSRVVADGGVVESGSCVDAVSSLLQSASLLLIPSGYKGGKLYSEIPTNGNGDLTWTRGSDAFRTNASGVLQRVPWNLLRYSEEFNNAVWEKGTGGSISANSVVAPNGTTTADAYTWATSTGSYAFLSQSASGSSQNPNTFSIWLKRPSGSGNRTIRLALTDVLVSTGASSTFTVTETWQRFEYTRTSASTTGNVGVGFLAGLTGTSIASGEILEVWGAQLVEGTTAQTYLPTTDRLNFPRLSYMYGSCPAVLLEPQRTNLALYSQEFDNAVWAKQSATVTANATTSPDGTQNADKIVITGNSNYVNQATAQLTNNTITFSVYAKKGTQNLMRIRESFYFGTAVTFDLNNGTITSGTGTIESVGDGWYRCTMTQAYGVGQLNINWIFNSPSSSGDFYLWGAQVEVGAYPTTYIPTTSATATRVADSAVKTGISSLIGQSEGVVFIDFIYGGASNESSNLINANRNSTSSFYVIRLTTGAIEAAMAIGGVGVAKITGSTIAVGTRYKVAYAYKSGSSALYINGVQIGTSSDSFTVTQSINEINLNDINSFFSVQRVAFFNSVALFTTRLTNAELATLTT